MVTANPFAGQNVRVSRKSAAQLLHQYGSAMGGTNAAAQQAARDELRGINFKGESFEERLVELLAIKEQLTSARGKDAVLTAHHLVTATNAILDYLDKNSADTLISAFGSLDSRSGQAGRTANAFRQYLPDPADTSVPPRNLHHNSKPADQFLFTAHDTDSVRNNPARLKELRDDATLSEKIALMNQWLGSHGYGNVFSPVGSTGTAEADERITSCLTLLNKRFQPYNVTLGTSTHTQYYLPDADKEERKNARNNLVLNVRAGGTAKDLNDCDKIGAELEKLYKMLNGEQQSDNRAAKRGFTGVFDEYLFNTQNILKSGKLRSNHVDNIDGRKLAAFLDGVLGAPLRILNPIMQAISPSMVVPKGAFTGNILKTIRSFRSVFRTIDSIPLLKPVTRIRQLRNWLDPERAKLERSGNTLNDITDWTAREGTAQMRHIWSMVREKAPPGSPVTHEGVMNYLTEYLYERNMLQCSPRALKADGTLEDKALTPQQQKELATLNASLSTATSPATRTAIQQTINNFLLDSVSRNKTAGINACATATRATLTDYQSRNYYVPLTFLGNMYMENGKEYTDALFASLPDDRRADYESKRNEWGYMGFSDMMKRLHSQMRIDAEVVERKINPIDWASMDPQQEANHSLSRPWDKTLFYSAYRPEMNSAEWIEDVESNTPRRSFHQSDWRWQKLRDSLQVAVYGTSAGMHVMHRDMMGHGIVNNLWDAMERIEAEMSAVYASAIDDRPMQFLQAKIVKCISALDPILNYCTQFGGNVPVPPDLWKRMERVRGWKQGSPREEQTAANFLRNIEPVLRNFVQEPARMHHSHFDYVNAQIHQMQIFSPDYRARREGESDTDYENYLQQRKADILSGNWPPNGKVEQHSPDKATQYGETGRWITPFVTSNGSSGELVLSANPNLNPPVTPNEWKLAVEAWQARYETIKSMHEKRNDAIIAAFKALCGPLADDTGGRLKAMANALEANGMAPGHVCKLLDQPSKTNRVTPEANNKSSTSNRGTGYDIPDNPRTFDDVGNTVITYTIVNPHFNAHFDGNASSVHNPPANAMTTRSLAGVGSGR